MKQVLAENSGIVEVRRRLNFLAITSMGLFVSTALFVSRASASIYTLTPGNSIAASPSAFPTGGSVLQNYTYSFTGTSSEGTIQGTVTSDVIHGDTSNPYGGLTFEYFLTLTGVNDVVGAFSAGGYAGFQTDVSYNPNGPGGGVAPSSFSRSPAGVNGGNTLTFFFSSPNISPGQSGAEIVVQTSASSFTLGSGNVMDSEGSPLTLLTPVPEPEIGSLAAMGLGALFIFLRRKSQ